MRIRIITIFGILIIVLIFFGVLNAQSLKDADRDKVREDTGLMLPKEAIVEFYIKKDYFNSTIYFLRSRMSKIVWESFIHSDLFFGQDMKPKQNDLSIFNDAVEGWNPPAVKSSISGIFNTEKGAVLYLFDVSETDDVVAYFKIGAN